MELSSGSWKKSKNAQPRILGSVTEVFSEAPCVPSLESSLRSHVPTRALTPSTPRPTLGQPNPLATVGGNANGKDAAEKNAIDNVGTGGLFTAGRSNCVARSVFSGIDRKDGMLYLHCGCQLRHNIDILSPTNHVSEQGYLYIAN